MVETCHEIYRLIDPRNPAETRPALCGAESPRKGLDRLHLDKGAPPQLPRPREALLLLALAALQHLLAALAFPADRVLLPRQACQTGITPPFPRV